MPSPLQWNFDIDRYLNPLIPKPPWKHVPYPIAFLLGHRKGSLRPYGNLLLILSAFIGVFTSIVLIEVVTHHLPAVPNHGPVIIASSGAAAVLEFYAIESPLSQPRNFFISQIIASVIGISFGKLFQLSPDFESIRWLGGALACASTTALMALTNTVHPPAGATALIAVVDLAVVDMGWFLIPVVILDCAIMMTVALILNNVCRRFPLYWWTAEDLGRPRDEPSPRPSSGDEEKAAAQHAELIITRDVVLVPDHVRLSSEEQSLVEGLRSRL
ncbi:Uu.00g004520.m01.CDS01 [Anthostomella pinea]|uniref:Uu.00g004520.m01.CDS01 n=1 Tax=Anthostomella pinea TaxID=933095 RepID=A0AAI8VKK3_9PEZI|nr:Uu.00g004520.m01.CDS01 [Anthostomella pinea]